MLRLIPKIILFIFLDLAFKYLVAWPLTPLVVLFVNKEGELPNWLYWFTTPDNPKLEDAGWIKESRPFLQQKNRFQRYVNRCFWLWRNSGYGFSESVMAIHYQPEDELVVKGDPNVSNGPPGVNGLVIRYLYRNKKLIAVQFYYVRRYKHFLTKKCIRVNVGWKLWSRPNGWKYASFAFSPWFLNSFKE